MLLAVQREDTRFIASLQRPFPTQVAHSDPAGRRAPEVFRADSNRGTRSTKYRVRLVCVPTAHACLLKGLSWLTLSTNKLVNLTRSRIVGQERADHRRSSIRRLVQPTAHVEPSPALTSRQTRAPLAARRTPASDTPKRRRHSCVAGWSFFLASSLCVNAATGCGASGTDSDPKCGLNLAFYGASRDANHAEISRILTCDLLRFLPPRAASEAPRDTASSTTPVTDSGMVIVGTLPEGSFSVTLPNAQTDTVASTQRLELRRRVIEAMVQTALPTAPRTREWLTGAVSQSGPGRPLLRRAQHTLALYLLTVVLPGDHAWPHALEVAEFMRFLSQQEGTARGRYPELFRYLNATDSLESAFSQAYDMPLSRGLSLWRTELARRLQWLPWLVSSACALLLLGAALWRRRSRSGLPAPQDQASEKSAGELLARPARNTSAPPPTYH